MVTSLSVSLLPAESVTPPVKSFSPPSVAATPGPRMNPAGPAGPSMKSEPNVVSAGGACVSVMVPASVTVVLIPSGRPGEVHQCVVLDLRRDVVVSRSGMTRAPP